ncbi:MAG: lysophospholipase [Microscillaceae bacterium]|jgi:pimeloyl-ACP methyl ester carboxylesterase|nr:lysophospholipase [Microscillaceae bacterium]
MEITRIPHFIYFQEKSAYKDTYGGGMDTVAFDAQLLMPQGVSSKTVILFMHPIGGLAYLPMPAGLAKAGLPVFVCNTRYRGVDSALIMEKCVADMGQAVKYLKEKLGFERVILGGWSGGGSLSLFYQAQAEKPSLTHTPAGDEFDLTRLNLLPCEGIMLLAAHVSRAHTLTEWLDASLLDEQNPNLKDLELDLYDPDNPHQPPYQPAFMAHYRAAQIARNRKITAWVQEKLNDFRKQGKPHEEYAFVTHGTMADPRFLDPSLDPNDRKPNWCYLGEPRLVNHGPVGLARFNTLRSWLSQWSYDLSNADGVKCAQQIKIPALVIGNSADDACTPSHTHRLYEGIGHSNKALFEIKGANHYYLGQPPQLAEALTVCINWLATQGFID